jgi:hypothetical protein
MPSTPDLDLLNSANYLYLREIAEPRDNSLRLVVQEAVSNRSGLVQAGPPELREILKDASPIESSESCRSFELSWKHYVAYLITEECVGSCGDSNDEIYTGNLFRLYTKSHFLAHLARDAGGHTNSVQHYKVICLNHLIDVACYAPPEIRLLSELSSPQLRIH